MLRQERHAHTEHHDSRVEVSECETSEQELLSFALLASEWIQNAKNIIDMMSFKSKQEVQDKFGLSHVIYSPFGVAVKTTKSIVAAWYHNHVDIKADVYARVFSQERGFGVTASHHPAH